jgi:hypothetical protein
MENSYIAQAGIKHNLPFGSHRMFVFPARLIHWHRWHARTTPQFARPGLVENPSFLSLNSSSCWMGFNWTECGFAFCELP